jgi:hypothetical protein
VRNCCRLLFLIVLIATQYVLNIVAPKAVVADSTRFFSSTVNVDSTNNYGLVNPFAWGVGAPDKYTWWAGNRVLEARIRDAGIKLVRVDPIQVLIQTGRDPYQSVGHPQYDGLDSILKTIFDAGAEPLFVVAGFPKGIPVSKDANGYIATADWNEYARFMTGIVRRYNVDHALGAGYSVRYWEMWNEPSIEGDGKFRAKEDYRAFVETVGTAMKREDPSIKLIGPAAPWADLGEGGWVAYAAKNLCNIIDILSWHNYGPGPGHDDAEALDWTTKSYENDIRSVNSDDSLLMLLNRTGKPFEAGITEYNISWQDGGASYNTKYHSQLNAAFAASAIIHAVRANAKMFCFYCLSETGANLLGLLSNSDYAPYKPYYVFSLFGNHFGERLLSATGDNSRLESVAAVQTPSGRYSMVLVNKDIASTCNVTVHFEHSHPGLGTVHVFEINSSSDVPISGTTNYSGDDFRYELQPLAIVSLEFGLDRGTATDARSQRTSER